MVKAQAFCLLVLLLLKRVFYFLPGIFLAAVLWLPIFLHFAWDFAEPGVFGAINPGITIDQSLLTSKN